MKYIKFSDYITVDEFVDFPHGVEIDRTVLSDAQLKKLLDYAGNVIQEYAEKPFLHQQVSETRWGSGSKSLVLPLADEHTKVVSCIERDMVDSRRNVTSYVKYNRGLQALILKDYYNSPVFCSDCEYEIVYTSGDMELNEKVKTACILTAANILRIQEMSGMKSVQIDIIKIQFQDLPEVISQEVKILLSDYVCSLNIV